MSIEIKKLLAKITTSMEEHSQHHLFGDLTSRVCGERARRTSEPHKALAAQQIIYDLERAQRQPWFKLSDEEVAGITAFLETFTQTAEITSAVAAR